MPPKQRPSDENRSVPNVKGHQDLLQVDPEKLKKKEEKGMAFELPSSASKIRIFG